MVDMLGVDINLSKSIISDLGVMEFAKRIVGPMGEISPIGPKNIVVSLKNPAMLPSLFLDYLGKGGDLDWTRVEAMFASLIGRKDILRLSKAGVESLVWMVLQPFGFISYPGLTRYKPLLDREEEIDPYLLLEGIDCALHDQNCREADSAIEKTMISVNALRSVIKRHQQGEGFIPPSYSWLLHESQAKLERLVSQVSSGLEPIYVDTAGKTLAEILHLKLQARPMISPLDNCLQSPTVPRPRIRSLNLNFFKRVGRYIQALENM